MLDPSSSEESEAELPPEDEAVVRTLGEKLPEKKIPKSEKAEKKRSGAVRAQQAKEAVPPAPEDEKNNEQETLQRKEAERKTKLQIYVFVLRCIAYPFNAKQPTDMARRQQKVRDTCYTRSVCSLPPSLQLQVKTYHNSAGGFPTHRAKFSQEGEEVRYTRENGDLITHFLLITFEIKVLKCIFPSKDILEGIGAVCLRRQGNNV